MTRSEDNDIWKPEEYLTYHKMVFREMFNFLNAHFPPGNDPEWWKQLCADLDQASEKLKGGKLTNGMLLAISDYLEEEYRKRRKNNEETDH